MKQAKKHFNLFVSIALLLLAVVYLTNITYSYFTTSHNAGGSIVFSDLDVQFYYKETSLEDDAITKEENTIELYSATSAISIGSPFQVALTAGGTAIYHIGFQATQNSCDAYVRFWIDAYIVKQDKTLDKTVNYGKYFLLPQSELYTNTNSSVSTSSCYFGVQAITQRVGLVIGNTLTLTDLEGDPVPVEILGETIQITISFEAVQKANQAYLSAFGDVDDTKGYLKSWS